MSKYTNSLILTDRPLLEFAHVYINVYVNILYPRGVFSFVFRVMA